MTLALAENPGAGRWLSRWAILTVAATFCLLGLGAVVTTFHVGMADPIWPTYPWHLLLISWEEPKTGYIIEHSHRAAGYIVGCMVIGLAVGLWLREPRRWVKWLGALALGGVIVQGLLGGFRVKLDQWLGTDLAFIHGCFGPAVFTLIVGIALLTSRGWRSPVTRRDAVRFRQAQRWSLAVVGLVYLQIVFGAFLRHTYSTLGPRGHLLVAFAVAASTACLVNVILNQPAAPRRLRVSAVVLAGLVGLQLFLGVEAWMFKYLVAGLEAQAIIRTAHVLVGALILAASVVVTLEAFRESLAAVADGPLSSARMEEAA